MCTQMFTTPVERTHLHMHGAHNSCQKWMHTLRKKCICTRACAHMQQCRRFFDMEAIANLTWVLREHRTGCSSLLALAAHPVVSIKAVARRRRPTLFAQKSVQIHSNSWRDRRCGVAQWSFAAAVLYKHHLIVCIGAGLIQFVYGSHSHLAADLIPTKFLFSP